MYMFRHVAVNCFILLYIIYFAKARFDYLLLVIIIVIVYCYYYYYYQVW